jgi:hypothetical protein
MTRRLSRGRTRLGGARTAAAAAPLRGWPDAVTMRPVNAGGCDCSRGDVVLLAGRRAVAA